ncbi:MAG TPA: thiolase domain-containing protein [Candidatus Caldiarchaeum subterraneum]|uniref:Thiolase domain-containing protein n=1 Tax=Caldiarchaeum subterraneum TaxID=311458 RepID=A0A832ZWT4_CALS0|nr:thiolase domain-containing protein [Aigarchaeota archaeon]HIQ30279.1 thiolase domain-containing protein [Candidatus Caldarchaeum subterraneum]
MATRRRGGKKTKATVPSAPKRRVAIVGAGITLFRRKLLEDGRELSYAASKTALESCGLTFKDVDTVVMASAPDAFDGVHMKGEYLAEGMLGQAVKPYSRVFIGGASGVFGAVAGWWHVASGLSDICLAVAEEKMSPHMPHPQKAFWTIFHHSLERPLGVNLLWIFALEMNRYMTTYGIKKEDIALVAVKNKRNALDHPAAQLAANITVEDVLKSEVIAWPVNRLDVSPPSDGAAAVVMVSEKIAKKLTDTPVWVKGVGWNLDTMYWTNRDLAYPLYLEKAAKQAYRMAGIENPRKEIHVAEVYDPFTYKELHHMEGLQLADKGQAPKLLVEGMTQRDGDLPVNPSGGLLGVGNPIAAAGMMKVCEIYWQLSQQAGKRQVKRPVETGLAQAWGDLMQASSVLILGV